MAGGWLLLMAGGWLLLMAFGTVALGLFSIVEAEFFNGFYRTKDCAVAEAVVTQVVTEAFNQDPTVAPDDFQLLNAPNVGMGESEVMAPPNPIFSQ